MSHDARQSHVSHIKIVLNIKRLDVETMLSVTCQSHKELSPMEYRNEK